MFEQKKENEGVGTGLISDHANYKILKQRAEILARVNPPSMVNEEMLTFTVFTLSDEPYGIENKYISEIRPLKVYTPLPGVPPHILGIINSRGKIISVVDLKRYFNLPSKGISELSKVIIVMHENMEFGLIVDTVIGVEQCSVKELIDSLPIFKGTKEVLLKGMTSTRIELLDGANLLNDQNLVVNNHT